MYFENVSALWGLFWPNAKLLREMQDNEKWNVLPHLVDKNQ